MFAGLSNSSDEAGKQNVFEVAASVDNGMHVYDAICPRLFFSLFAGLLLYSVLF